MPNTAFDPITEVNSLLEALVKAVVTQPDLVKITHTVHGQLVAIGVHVAQDDVRRVIGARGKHVKALQVIVKQLCESVGKTSDLSIVEDGPPPPKPAGPERTFPLAQGRDFKPVKKLLERTVFALANSQQDVDVVETPMGSKHIFEIRANESAYRRLYGATAQFEYGEDGLVLGSLKNLFDAISKNHGKLVMMVMNKRA